MTALRAPAASGCRAPACSSRAHAWRSTPLPRCAMSRLLAATARHSRAAHAAFSTRSVALR
eukprot:5019767-Lingulodinium_polyedra.AAC.2